MKSGRAVLAAVLCMLLVSGCMSAPVRPKSEQSLEPQPLEDDAGDSVPVPQDVPTTTTAVSVSMPGNLAVRIAGCDTDDMGNSIVAGWVTNTGTGQSGQFSIVARLLDSSGQVVDSGEKKERMESLDPGASAKFSVVFPSVPPWRRCTATPTQ